MKNKLLTLLASSALLASLAIGAPANKVVPDGDMSLRSVDLDNEDAIKLLNAQYPTAAPGTAPVMPRSYENAPPLIPHSIEGLVPITAGNNACLSCHVQDVAQSMNTLPVPISHRTNLRTGKVLPNNEVSDSRYNCTQCHVPQANAKPLVENNFKPTFRNLNLKNKSNLNMKTINEGVK